ncbi:MAG: substrate-binding domain-containing protein [Clostridiales bacterium]|nr:substrate-binding domain-containing protein [Clostridiales bacterium]
MMRLRIATIICLAVLFLSGCTVAPEQPEDELSDILGLSLDESKFPRVDGSTATIPLGEALAALMMNKDRAECKKYADFNGTNQAYINLANNEADILLVYEIPGDAAEITANRPFEEASIGRDGLVFIVNAQNPVDNLTSQQVVDIYSGTITNWREVGGDNAAIAAFQRNETSGSQTLMKKLVMNKTPLPPARENFIAWGMSEIITSIADYDNGRFAIGYNVYYYVAEMEKDPNIKVLSIDGVYPDNNTIASGKYPFVNDFYAVIRENAPKSSPERLLFRWLQTGEGQMLIDSQGYVSLKNAR